MNLKDLHSVYFLGIGGIGMSAIARWFNHIGVPVWGYDKTPSPLTHSLESEGMKITYTDSISELPGSFLASTENRLVIWTPAIPKDSVLKNYLTEQGYELKKRSEVLGLITKDMYSVAVAGTHGKTTTSSMVAHLLKHAGKNIAAFLGGLTQNYQSNLILNDEESDQDPIVVVEADEFDRSFLHLHPNISILTSADPDHLDIYADGSHVMEGFRDFLALTAPKGMIIGQYKALEKLAPLKNPSVESIPYGIGSKRIRANNIVAGIRGFRFDYVNEDEEIKDLYLPLPGFHNIENALAAITTALHFGVDEETVKAGLLSYRGVKRRFELVFEDANHVYIDDYAHHPEEIRAFLASVRAIYPNKRITAVFQPHLFTRTRDFAEGFSESLSLADEVILLDIYPARELPIPGVTSDMLLEGIKAPVKSLQTKEGLIPYLAQTQPEVLVTIGAGDIDRLVEPIHKWLSNGN
ncbi:UDP-N-acetylmuramate--alanine ligase [Lunatimonas lonarensis]|uniref:UDP-N-acetylmuramate--L-alanine ligase n=1 Tax=Lunatimonas lonarensis TaxID=1232681 RepID=R7ZS50_9BACT|nr:UDP-N-acetylmuramate--L-alanine ligase [Lunatimonas lonarensis]EON76912.1 UDP-N-acetylmuramate--alanine ligase [Lunatimonas lonarensis]